MKKIMISILVTCFRDISDHTNRRTWLYQLG